MIKARSSLLNKQDLEILEGFKKKQQRYLDEATANSELICVWVLILTPFMLLLTWWALLPGMVLAYHLWKCGVAIYRSREVAKIARIYVRSQEILGQTFETLDSIK